ncbi:MAG: aminoacyl-histidine dipeptidase [Bacteroidales bacterium]|nr:aminoacyl-histidine dipeptidase [Bacteroidales bacterium]
MMTIKDLEPKIVFDNFYQLTRIPRPSKHEAKIIAFLLEWGKTYGVETVKDDTGNIIMRIPATPGFENRKGVILQGHMDMVPQKNSDKVHDFENDPIETWVDGEWLKAKGTTLGADNGLGVAMAMSVLEDKSLKHGPVEVLITYDEETGMTGARALKPGMLNGDILINLDSETEGELYVGCAGGLDASATATYRRMPEPESGYECYELAVKGCKGGHSGMDIILCRANANKAIARVLLPLLKEAGVKLIDLEGGTLRNAIPREAFATLYVPTASVKAAKAIVKKVEAEIKNEYAATDPDAQVIFKPYECKPGEVCNPDDCKYVSDAAALRFVRAILACPDGVDRMSDQMPGLVETSNNMAMVKIEKGKFSVHSLLRGSVDSGKEFLAQKLAAGFENAGCKVTFSGGYSGWAPNAASPILHTMKQVYKDMYGAEPKVMAIHAGLECGILGGTYPNWDMVSFGPTLMSPHSPDERAYIPSVQKAWDFLKAVLEAIPEK